MTWNTRRVERVQIAFEKLYSMAEAGPVREMRVNLLTFGGERFSVSHRIGSEFDLRMAVNGIRSDIANQIAEGEAMYYVCTAIKKEVRANLHRENCITF